MSGVPVNEFPKIDPRDIILKQAQLELDTFVADLVNRQNLSMVEELLLVGDYLHRTLRTCQRIESSKRKHKS